MVNPYTGLQSLCQNVWNTQNLTIMTFGDKLAKVNLDSEDIDEIQLANLIFLAFKLEVPTLNTKWWFCIQGTFKKMAKIVKKTTKHWLILRQEEDNSF